MGVMRRRREYPEMPNVEPRSFVKVLGSEGELEDALRWAALYERRAAQITGERAARYEAMMQKSSKPEPAGAQKASSLTGLQSAESDGRHEAA